MLYNVIGGYLRFTCNWEKQHKNNPFAKFKYIDEEIISDLHAFLDRYVENDTEADESTLEEASKIHEVLDNMDLYRAFGAALYAEDDVIVGFSLGEYDGDTLYVTEAPYVQWQKILGAITGSASSARNLQALTQ